MKQVNNIKELGISLADLYDAKKQINLHIKNSPFVYSIILKDRKGFDCKISSFGANLYIRTKKGLEYKKYASLGTLQSGLKKIVKQKISDENITFSLSDEVYTF